MAKKILTTPIKAEDLEDIHIGDIIYLTGHITTCRDVAHRRLIEGGRKLPVDLEGGAILHAGPIIRPLEDGRYEMVSVGPPPACAWRNLRWNLSGKRACAW